jgi:5'-nucleotidase
MEGVVIPHPGNLQSKIERIRKGGFGNMHVVADFDKTLTTAFFHGEKRQSLVELIRKYKYLPDGYVKQAYALFDRFHPYENNPSLSPEERSLKMEEWWSTHVKVMGEYGLNREIVSRIVREQPLNARPGLRKFLDNLNARQIPLLIFSASVTDLIEGLLVKEQLWRNNIHVFSNRFAYDSTGQVTGYEGKIIHSLNKGEHALEGMPYFQSIRGRSNVLLLGDSLDDVDMVNGFGYDTVLKIGFLNDKAEELLPHFRERFDAVILDDGPMDFVNELLSQMLE